MEELDPLDGEPVSKTKRKQAMQDKQDLGRALVELPPDRLKRLLGKVELSDGRWLSGFICEGYGLQGATDITGYGGWRAWLTRG